VQQRRCLSSTKPRRRPTRQPARPSGFWIQHDGRGVLRAQTGGSGVEINKVGSILLIVGLVGVVPSLLLLFWSSRARRNYSF
jgi:hypothetical protein